MLLNYNGKYTDMSTVAHELGHTMQSYFSNKTQPFPTASLPDLRGRGRLDLQRGAAHRPHAQDDQGRRHEAVAARQLSRGHQGRRCSARPSSPSSSCACTRWPRRASRSPAKRSTSSTPTSRKKYYGHDKGVCIVDDYIAHEWAFIPHFYRNFYVFQYATSFTASAALSEKVMAGDPAALKRYLDVPQSPAARNIRSSC